MFAPKPAALSMPTSLIVYEADIFNCFRQGEDRQAAVPTYGAGENRWR